ncbi:MAG: hypothetical protein EOO02_20975 [Chitinophagaceae bacterium]|nr:MAG: hypothetical protein EOO02_20975 [Chitinophagaceae bacterium]
MSQFILRVPAAIMVMLLVVMQACQTKTTSRLLSLNLEKGKMYEYEVVTDQQQEMMEQKSEIRATAAYQMQVLDVKAGVQTVKVTYKKFKMHMKIMEFVLDIDTDNPGKPLSSDEIQSNPLGMMGNIFEGIKDKSFTLQLDKEGSILSVTGFDKILKDMISPLQVDENSRLQISASLQDQFNEENIKDQFRPFFNIFPNNEVKPGDSWEKSWKTGGRMPSSFVTTYTVKDIDGDHVNLITNTKIMSDRKEMEIKGTQKGPLLIDSKSGLVISGSFDQETDAVYQNMEIRIKSKAGIKGKEL